MGEISAERAAVQFDLRATAPFATLAEAESAIDGRRGFLIEAAAPFTDGTGHSHQRGVFFVAGLS